MRRPVSRSRVIDLDHPGRGLSTEEAAAQARRFGPNKIIETPAGHWRELLLDTARDPMLWFLAATGGLFALVGERVEAAILLLALVPLVCMDLYLHRRTQASTVGLASRLASQATALRDGRSIAVPAEALVPGDLVRVVSGALIPADGIVLEGDALQVDESALTGEAYPVRKHPLAEVPLLDGETPIDTSHWAFAGTRLLTGSAQIRIAYTGADTLYGEIVRSAMGGARARTPLQMAIADLVRVLLVAAGVLCLILAWVRLEQGYGPIDAMLSAVTLAVAALPEEFPVVFAFFLGLGVYRLARRQALVRRAVAVENIGRVSCICADKTGTITEGELRLTHCYPIPDIDEVRLLRLAAAASRAESADPLDAAILAQAKDAWPPRLAVFPFTEDRKRETAVLRQREGALLAAVKGAPEVVLGQCDLGADEIEVWRVRTEELAAAGHKVIACAWRELGESGWSGGEPDRGFHLAGLLAFEDPVREGVKESIRRCREAGIHVLMITGDHPATAAAVAREIGLGSGSPRVVKIDEVADQDLPQGGELLQVDVIARAIPSRKLGIVRALQRAGMHVAVTGDGVNDVPALQAADIGIAMGERGTRSAREVAAMVLLDDNFRTIVRAIAEGHQLFRNLRMSFAYLLMIHIPLVVSAALIPLAGYPLLYLPVHVVWLELIIHPTAILVFQNLPVSERLPPVQRRRARFFSAGEWLMIAVVGLLLTATAVVGYERSLGIGREVEHARAMAMIALTMASATLTLGLGGLRNRVGLLLAALTVASSILLVQAPLAAKLLHLTPLHVDDWALAVAAGIAAALLPALAWRRSAT